MTDGTPAAGRVLALDLGSRRIGVAVSDAGRSMAFPRPFVARRGDPGADLEAVVALVADAEAAVVVVGLPLSLDGSEGPAARSARDEAARLAEALGGRGVAVETFDERLTTVSAGSALRQAGVRTRDQRTAIDSAAAAVLLQAWLDRR